MKKVILFGASTGGKRVFRSLSGRCEVVAFADNDPDKQGARFLGKEVLKPEQIRDAGADAVIIASSYSREILKQLRDLGLPEAMLEVADLEVLITPEASGWGRWLLLLVGVIAVVVVWKLT